MNPNELERFVFRFCFIDFEHVQLAISAYPNKFQTVQGTKAQECWSSEQRDLPIDDLSLLYFPDFVDQGSAKLLEGSTLESAPNQVWRYIYTYIKVGSKIFFAVGSKIFFAVGSKIFLPRSVPFLLKGSLEGELT